ncbi:MAG: hypothetical protein ACI4VG_01280 [Lachnospiraceae bacterium]
MKNTLKKRCMELLLIAFFLILLIFSRESVRLASQGLLIWYRSMIPSLFPFMVLSGFLVRSKMAEGISRLFCPFLSLLFPRSYSIGYTILIGFLCGFPMGAKVVADLLETNRINEKEGEYLLAFCNNIGPLYILGYVIPLFKWENIPLALGLMYAVPLLYGFFLQFLPRYRNTSGSKQLSCCESSPDSFLPQTRQRKDSFYLTAFRDALENAITQMTLLGGCMIFFNCLQIAPKLIPYLLPSGLQSFYTDTVYGPLCGLIEIGGGLKILSVLPPSLSSMGLILFLLTLGGLSCMVQTAFVLKNTTLSIWIYLKHKLVQALLILFLFSLMNPA